VRQTREITKAPPRRAGKQPQLKKKKVMRGLNAVDKQGRGDASSCTLEERPMPPAAYKEEKKSLSSIQVGRSEKEGEIFWTKKKIPEFGGVLESRYEKKGKSRHRSRGSVRGRGKGK